MAADQERAERIRQLKADHPEIRWRMVGEYVGVTERAAQEWQKTGGIEPANAKKLAELFDVSYEWLWFGREFGTDNGGQTPDPFRQSVNNDTELRLANLEAQVAVNTALLEVIAKHLGVARVNEQVEEALAQPPRRIPESLREALRTAGDRLRAQETQGTPGSRQAG